MELMQHRAAMTITYAKRLFRGSPREKLYQELGLESS